MILTKFGKKKNGGKNPANVFALGQNESMPRLTGKTIISRARMGSELLIAHEAEVRMGY